MTKSIKLSLFGVMTLFASAAMAQVPAAAKPADTEVWKPVPTIITPGRTNADPPSDAIILFDGRNQNEWVLARDGSPATWTVAAGVLTVNNSSADFGTNPNFRNNRRTPDG